MSTPTPGSKPPQPVAFEENSALDGLQMVLRDAQAAADAGGGDSATAHKRVHGQPLATADTARLLSRVDDLQASEEDQQAFKRRTDSKPAPRTGETLDVPFPPPESPSAPDTPAPGTLTVERFAPEGAVDLAPHLSITFSRPMVAVSAQPAASTSAPVHLSPTPSGSWRWLGTRTLVFKPDGRFPMATRYEVTVPAGTRATDGSSLNEALTFSFETPPPRLVSHTPTEEPWGLSPVISLQFDQHVAKAQVLAHTQLSSSAGSHPLRLATQEEIDEAHKTNPAEPAYHQRPAGRGSPHAAASEESDEEAEAEAARRVHVVPQESLKKATRYTVTVGAGTPSLEGPQRTTKAAQLTFRTYRALEVASHSCGWGRDCDPAAPFSIELNNPLDEERFDPAQVRIEPAAPGTTVSASGRYLVVAGRKQGRRTYKVTLDKGLTDHFGQTLGSDKTLDFEVDAEASWLRGPSGPYIILDPAGPKAVTLHSVNMDELRATVHRVTPRDYHTWIQWYNRARWDRREPARMPGEQVFEGKLKLVRRRDEVVQTMLPLDDYLRDGHGHFIVYVRPTGRERHEWPGEVLTWIQVTDLGLTAFQDPTQVMVWATELSSGQPLADVSLELFFGDKTIAEGNSDALGLSRLDLPETNARDSYLIAQTATDSALLPTWLSHDTMKGDRALWYTFDDRGLYRPGETAAIKGWIRRQQAGPQGDLLAIGTAGDPVTWTLYDPRRNKLSAGKTQLSAQGGFSISVKFPDDTNLGDASLSLHLPNAPVSRGTSHVHRLSVQEFRRPEFEVDVHRSETTEGPFILGTEALLTLRAAYYAGGGLAGAPVHWTTTARAASYRPPNREEYSFGPFQPDWWWGPRPSSETREEIDLQTGPDGASHLGVHFRALNPQRPMSVQVEGAVRDVNNQSWSGQDELLVHPAAAYVGLRSERTFVAQGDPIEIEALAVDLQGAAMSGLSIEIESARIDYAYRQGRSIEEARDKQRCQLTSSAAPQRCTFTTKLDGMYRLRATVRDRAGRPNDTTVQVWVGSGPTAPSRDLEQEQVRLIPEHQEVQAGETARFLVQAPFYPARGMMLVERSGIVSKQAFELSGPSKTFDLPVTEAHIPGFTVQIELVGKTRRSDDQGKPRDDLPQRVAYATGSLSFKVPALRRTLSVQVSAEARHLNPGGKTVVHATVTDADSKPVPGAELALLAADESVLALSGYQLPDPIEVFYAGRPALVDTRHLRERLALSDPELAGSAAEQKGALGGYGAGLQAKPEMMMRSRRAIPPPPSPAPMGQMESRAADLDTQPANAAGLSSKITTRSRFDALALYKPELRTDAQGRVSVPLELPDSLTRYRVMAVAVHGDRHFGKGESDVTARLPLMVRPSPPRFLSFGDRFELPVVIQNQTDEPLATQVALRASNVSLGAAEQTPQTKFGGVSAHGVEVEVPAGGRVEVLFPAAVQQAGKARFQIVAASKRGSDAANFELPVYTPATSEAFATYGAIDQGTQFQPISPPKDVWPQFGGLEITTSSTQLSALTDAFLYLVRYPFDCNEQLASRMLAITALRDVLKAFNADGLPDTATLNGFVEQDLKRLATRQSHDGGFAFWRSGDRTWPYLTVHVAHALSRARAKGYEVEPTMWKRVLDYLQNIGQHIPGWYSRESRYAIHAYALSVRRRMGDVDGAQALGLLRQAGEHDLSLEAIGLLLPVLDAAGHESEVQSLLRLVTNSVTETAAGAHFVTHYSDGAHVLLHSDRRADGVLLESLIEVAPDSELILKLVKGLLAHRKRGKWHGTQENAFVLSALERYFRTYEKVTPDFVARVWLGPDYIGEHTFKGRSADQAHHDIPMAALDSDKDSQLLAIAKQGEGRLYYRVGLRYAPKALELPPADHGFALQRSYEAIDAPDEVWRDREGRWHVKAGARVRVRLSMATPMRRYHVALVDPLPAGLEAVNPALAVSGDVPEDPQAASAANNRYWWWWRPWYEHQNLRDERVEAFTSLLWEGVHEYSYVARATTPGEFVVGPTRAEEMYSPETFGRSATERMIVE